MNSKRKGKGGELELAAFLREHGFDARRGRQFNGADGSADVTGLEGWHIECKRVEQGNLYDWLDQAKRDSGNSKPVVMHRRNNEPWVAIIDLADFIALVCKS